MELKKTISQEQYLAIQGLRALANQHNKGLSDLYTSAGKILGDDDSHGLICDLIYDESTTVEHILKSMDILVIDIDEAS